MATIPGHSSVSLLGPTTEFYYSSTAGTRFCDIKFSLEIATILNLSSFFNIRADPTSEFDPEELTLTPENLTQDG